ncbi:hypothetical protein E1B28_000463 [Marasmius oreades]|uniref:Inhibitor I9 domain-containing protein n=1 Tax=Marasmius oreades TaxID=181124 RepID=A0A9P7V1G5_9AGAR|nr:uncharacterized protein E1B28_000463 [Marasmius oreades]KAG7098523.1 hypothetical protein E1B28_000463 [Marasmius oreades]
MPDKFMVIFKPGTPQSEIDKYVNQVQDNGGEVHHKFDSTLHGFSATIPETQLQQLQSLQASGPIEYIEPDTKVTIQ